METHSSVLAWRIPGTGEPGGLPSMGLHRVGHDWSNLAAAAAAAAAYLWLIHAEVWQKTTKFCKAIILQLKKIFLIFHGFKGLKKEGTTPQSATADATAYTLFPAAIRWTPVSPNSPASVGPPHLCACASLRPWDFLGKSTGVGCHCLLQISGLNTS